MYNHICNITTCILNVVVLNSVFVIFCKKSLCTAFVQFIILCCFIIYELCLLHSCYTHGGSSNSYLKLPYPSITLIEAHG